MTITFINIFLGVDFFLLAIVIAAYARHALEDRKSLHQVSTESVQLQQKVYQIQVLQEIGERIGYSLDTNKIVEIITSSLGTLLDYDAVSYMVFKDDGSVVFKSHVENTVNHRFISEVKEDMLASFSAIFNKEIKPANIDFRITGNILDDNLKVSVGSFFNLPIVISGKLIGLINVASTGTGKYGEGSAAVLYSITNQASTAVSKLQEVLESEKGKLSAIIYSMADGVVMVDLQHQLLVSNPAIKSILGIDAKKEFTMFDIVDALAGKIDLRIKIEQALSEDKAIVIEELFLRDKALELTITPVKNKEGEKLGATVVFHDITSEKSLEKLRQEFTAMMVHELRAPLTAVRWSSDSLLKALNGETATAADPNKLKDSVMSIQAASVNMLELVNDLLDVAKIEAGKFDLNVQDYDLVPIIQQEVTAFQAQSEIKHLTINVTTPEKCMVKCDRVRISQVLTNLISNAIKYTDSGQIDVNLSVDAALKKCVVSIKDSGIGVSEEDLYQLFSKFKQLKGADSARKGTGLGLVVSKGIVEAHGGQIWAKSAGESLGTTFYFSLPI